MSAMTFGRCSGCAELTYLPAFGAGQCFLCATDGPPVDRSTTGGALAEDGVRSDPTAEWWEPSEMQSEIAELFDEHRSAYANAICADAIRAHRFERGVRARSRRSEGLTLYEQREIEERKTRRERRRAERRLRCEARRRERDERAAHHAAALDAMRLRHERRVENYVAKVSHTWSARRGAGNYADPAKIEAARRLRAQGLSLRQVAAAVGLTKETVSAYTKTWVSRAEGLRRHHKRRQAEGRPIYPPWYKKTG